MKILYISNYLDKAFFKKIFTESIIKPEQNMQKYNDLFVNGMVHNKKIDNVTVISAATVTLKMHKKLLWKGKNYSTKKIDFWYLPFINIKFIKQICMLLFSIFYILFWLLRNLFKEKYIIVDGFYPIVSTIAIVFGRLFGVYTTTFYTDIVKYDVNDYRSKKNFVRLFIKRIINIGDAINRHLTNAFIFITRQMNDLINKNNKPYIVIDCLVDDKKATDEKTYKKEKAFLYAGGLYEKYGVKLLIDSFISWNNGDYELWLCGDGDLVSYIESLNNQSVKYFGVLLNDQVLKLEKKAEVLVNPRFTDFEYTKYSFPSKNMEYMLSGTPMLTTKLPGMSDEYTPYVFYFESEDEKGFCQKFEELSLLSTKSLNKKGKNAKEYVLKEKNNKLQCKRIIDFILNSYYNSILKNRIISFFAMVSVVLFLLLIFSGSQSLNIQLSIYCAITMNVFVIKFISKDEKKKNQKLDIIQNILIITMLSSQFLIIFGTIDSSIKLNIVSILAFFFALFIYCILDYKKYLLFILFLTSFFTFGLGQYVFANVTSDFLYYSNFNSFYVANTITIQYMALAFTFLGYSFINNNNYLKTYQAKNTKYMSLFSKFIFVILVISFTCSVISNLETAYNSIKYGYLYVSNENYMSKIPRIISLFGSYYYILLTFFIANSKNKKHIIIALIFLLINSVISLLTGGRFDFVFAIFFIVFLYIYYYIQGKIGNYKTMKKFAMIGIIVVPLLLVSMSIYNSVRNKKNVSEINPMREVAAFFVSQGRSANLITYSQIYYDELSGSDKNYVFGLFYESIRSKICLLNFKMCETKIDKNNINYGYAISNIVLGEENVKKGHGLGSQYIAEIFLDGGLISIILYSLFFGWIIAILYKKSFNNFICFLFMLNILVPVLHLMRSVSFELFAPFTSMALLLLLFIYFVLSKITKGIGYEKNIVDS